MWVCTYFVNRVYVGASLLRLRNTLEYCSNKGVLYNNRKKSMDTTGGHAIILKQLLQEAQQKLSSLVPE